MKKWFAMVMMCVLLITSFTCTGVVENNVYAKGGFVIELNGQSTEFASIIHNNIHYVPMRKIFEKTGSAVFFRSRDSKVLILTRDGDVISHIIGESIITVNNEEKTFNNPSIIQNNETYIPIDMASAALCLQRFSYEKQRIKMQKPISNNDYNRVVEDVLEVCDSDNFNPENFISYVKYHTKMPKYSIQEVLFRVNLELDSPFYENITTIENPNNLLVLVNKYNQLPSGFKQKNLVNMDRKYTINDGKEYLLQREAYEKCIEMFNAAKKAGLSMKVVSAYRTEDYQRNLYNQKVRTAGKVHADNYSARAGHSEHQTGLAVDINSTSVSFEYTAEFKWLKEHAHEYGFILRYQKDKEWITGYSYEPWHYRYVGADVAKVIHEEGITYEEYYAKYISAHEFQ